MVVVIVIMVINIQIKPKVQEAQPVPKAPSHRFTLKDVEELFTEARKDWKAFYKKNETKFWKENLDVYKWVVFPLITKDDIFYRCVLHDVEMVNVGDGHQKAYTCKNIHLEEVISHCVFYTPEEHKQYIIEKLKLGT